MKFCPKCGKKETKDNKLIGEICQECFSKENSLLKGYKEYKIIRCSYCGSFLEKNLWNPPFSNNEENNVKEIVKKTLPSKLVLSLGFNLHSLKINPKIKKGIPLKKQKIETDFIVAGEIHGIKSKEKFTLEIPQELSICNNCKRQRSSYYEAIIQIRPKDEKLRNFIVGMIKENKNVSVTKEEKPKFGYNLYITSKRFLSEVLSVVKKKFNIEHKFSSTLFGRKNGRDVYRTTLLIRLKEETL